MPLKCNLQQELKVKKNDKPLFIFIEESTEKVFLFCAFYKNIIISIILCYIYVGSSYEKNDLGLHLYNFSSLPLNP